MYKQIEELLTETDRLAEEGDRYGYEAFVELVEKRQRLLDALERNREPLPDSCKEMLRSIAEKDAVILAHMQRLKKEAEDGLVRLAQAKKQRAAYQAEGIAESFMFDKRN